MCYMLHMYVHRYECGYTTYTRTYVNANGNIHMFVRVQINNWSLPISLSDQSKLTLDRLWLDTFNVNLLWNVRQNFL